MQLYGEHLIYFTNLISSFKIVLFVIVNKYCSLWLKKGNASQVSLTKRDLNVKKFMDQTFWLMGLAHPQTPFFS